MPLIFLMGAVKPGFFSCSSPCSVIVGFPATLTAQPGELLSLQKFPTGFAGTLKQTLEALGDGTGRPE